MTQIAAEPARGAPASAPAPTDLLGAATPELARVGVRREHYPALDGLRGIAILLVLACHYYILVPVPGAAGAAIGRIAAKGWVGVDLFFVLSGFLITGILLDAKSQDHYFRNFYARRMLRIFPLYYGVLSALLLFCLLALPFARGHFAARTTELLRYQPWLWTYTANIAMAIRGRLMFLVSPFWSLSVEEQFYLAWPLVVLLLGRRGLMSACLVAALGALALRLAFAASGASPLVGYLLTPCRMDALAAGAFVATLYRTRFAPRVAACALLVGAGAAAALVAMFGAMLIFHVSWISGAANAHNPGGTLTACIGACLYTVLAAFFASLLAIGAAPQPWARRLAAPFRWRPLRVVGRYSYGIYVYHYIIFTIVLLAYGYLLPGHRGPLARATLLALNLVLTAAVAVASFHLFEKPFLKLKRHFPEYGQARDAGAKPARTSAIAFPNPPVPAE